MADHVSYEAGPDVVDFQIAFGALPNHHCLLSKLDYLYPECKCVAEGSCLPSTPLNFLLTIRSFRPHADDDSMADRFLDPGAGAFTYSHGRQFTVRKAVQGQSATV